VFFSYGDDVQDDAAASPILSRSRYTQDVIYNFKKMAVLEIKNSDKKNEFKENV
jgi:hypothetical protein